MTRRKNITAEDLGIKLSARSEKELFRWLMAVLLFAKPVQQEVAAHAFEVLRKKRIDTPDALMKAGWQRIVDCLGEGHYVRYDESTATRLLDASEKLKKEYRGRVLNVLKESETSQELAKKLQEFNGIGPKAAQIFLRPVRPIWYDKR